MSSGDVKSLIPNEIPLVHFYTAYTTHSYMYLYL